MSEKKSILKADMFERFLMQNSSTINEVSLVIFGLSPFTTAKNIPEDLKPFVTETRIYMRRSLNTLSDIYKLHFQPATECYMRLILAVAHRYINEKTPDVISESIVEMVKTFIYINKWEEHIRAIGGEELLRLVSDIRKTGRGEHKKSEEMEGTNKMMGLLVKLLVSKSDRYGTQENPKVSEIYNDVLKIVDSEELTTKGIARPTFYKKIKLALESIHD